MEIAISQPGVPGAQRLKLDPKGFRTVGLNAGALLKDPVVKVEGQAGKTWLYKLELTAPRLDIAGTGAANGFKVRRVIKNTDGSDVIKVGDLVKVTVFIDVAGKGQRYVVLDDPLPAGLMALNTAFKTEETCPGGRRIGARRRLRLRHPGWDHPVPAQLFRDPDRPGAGLPGPGLLRLPAVRVLLPGRVRGQVYGCPPPGWRPCTRRE